MNKIGAVITGGDYQGLGVIRSLGRRGVPVCVVDHEFTIGRFSKYTNKFSASPKPANEESYLSFLITFAQKNGLGRWVLFPNNDRVVSIVSRHKEVLTKHYLIPTPDWETVQCIYDKKNTYRLAEQIGIPIPKTFYPTNLEEAGDMQLDFPVIIKPSIRDNFYDKTKIKALLIKSRGQLVSTYKKVISIIDPAEVLIQEFIPGGSRYLYSFAPLFKNGKVLARIMARRLRQHPIDFGHATTYAEAVDIPEIEELGSKFLSHINYYGLAEVEFMLDPRNMTYKFLEVNGRVWGWHTLARGAGVDLPFLLFQDITGQALEKTACIKGMKWMRLTTDIPTALAAIIKRQITWKEYINSLRGKKEFAVYSRDDPMPFLAELLLLPYMWFKRGF